MERLRAAEARSNAISATGFLMFVDVYRLALQCHAWLAASWASRLPFAKMHSGGS